MGEFPSLGQGGPGGPRAFTGAKILPACCGGAPWVSRGELEEHTPEVSPPPLGQLVSLLWTQRRCPPTIVKGPSQAPPLP